MELSSDLSLYFSNNPAHREGKRLSVLDDAEAFTLLVMLKVCYKFKKFPFYNF